MMQGARPSEDTTRRARAGGRAGWTAQRCVLLLLLVCPLRVFAQSGTTEPIDLSQLHRRFATANEHYQNRQFKEALAGYQGLIDGGVRDSLLYYNAGNTYVQLGQKGRAAAMFERARRLAPRDDRVGKNLAYVRPPGAATVPFILGRPFLFLRDLFSLNEWLVIAEIAVFGTALFWSLMLLLRPGLLQTAARRLLIVGFAAIVIVAGFLPWRRHEECGRRVGIVIEREVVSRHGPSEKLGEHLKLAEGSRVEILGQEGADWLFVEPLDGPRASRQRTYVKREALEEI